RRRLLKAVAAAAVCAYAVLVLLYRGDPFLAGLRYGLGATFGHAGGGHIAPAFLLGATSPDGWWYFFPTAFFWKTPAAMHILLALAAVAGLRRRPSWRTLASSPLRAPLVACLFFGAAL